jgi:hypothetical protein
MESFFLSETLKYLYLLFDENNVVHRRPHIFSTEAHFVPMRAGWMRGDDEPGAPGEPGVP